MIAVLSATEHDFYAMPLPFAVFSWAKIGVKVMVFIPEQKTPKIELAMSYCPNTQFYRFSCEEKRIPTYSQVSRLFAAGVAHVDESEAIITSDSDICVFGDYFSVLNDGFIHVVGADLTPKEQYPMCFIAMPVNKWRKTMNIQHSYQRHLSEIIDPIEGQNIRGEQWCYDQWYAKKMIGASGEEVRIHNRAKEGTQFATKRADRDGWHFNPYDIIDAHLPRPLTDDENFKKVYDLFEIKYPHDDLSWMKTYQEEYKKLL